MEIWLQKGSTKIQLPVNPAEVGGTKAIGFDDVTIVGDSEKSIFNTKNLADFSLSAFFPKEYDTSYCACKPTKKPWEYVALIKGWMDSGEPIKLIITTTNVNEDVTIRSFDYKAKAGHDGDVWYVLDLKEHKPIKINRIAITVPDSTPEKPVTKPAAPKKYTVKKGDCLWNIAKKFYGNGSKWPTIYNANKKVIGKNPNLIYPGQVYTIP